MPLPGRSLTSVLLRRGGELFLFDCGEGTQVSLRRLNLKWKKISVIFISHTHADHVTGLPGILMLTSQVDRDDPLYIFGPPRIAEYVAESRRILDMHINYQIVVKEILEPGIIYQGSGYQVRAFPLLHSKPCLGYSLEEERRPGVFSPDNAVALGIPRGPLWSRLQGGEQVELESGLIIQPEEVMGPYRSGRKFGFITDTAFKPGLHDFVENADLLICEGMFAEELEQSAKEKKHLTAKQAALIAFRAGVKKLGLIHYSPRYSERELKQLRHEAREIFHNTFLTRDLQVLKIPYVD